MIIGITGRVGSGKSKATEILKKEFDFHIIDLDVIGHDALKNKSIKENIVKEFKGILTNSDDIDRKKLGNIVFNNTQELKKLNSIVHPYIFNTTKKLIKSNKNVIKIVTGALMYELSMNNLCDVMIVIDADDQDIRNFSDRFDKIKNHQLSKHDFIEKADIVIENNFDETFEIKLLNTVKKILKKEKNI